MIGFYMQKMMMSSYITETSRLPVTILKTTESHIVGYYERDKHYAFRMGFFVIHDNILTRYSKSFLNSYQKECNKKYRLIKEFKILKNDNNTSLINKLINKYESKSTVSICDIFNDNMKVKIKGVVKGRGFTGPMKRHNFAGLSATHGVSLAHRTHGSVGSCNPNNIYKGRKMAGRYGGTSACILNLKILKVDEKNHLLYVFGSIPGCKNSIVVVSTMSL